MIAMISGPIAASGSDYVIVDTHGVGYMVSVPKPLLARLNDGDQVTLYTNLVVREDSLTLYGFESWGQRLLFDQLLAVSGIGPKVAMNLLSSLSPDDLRSALASGDVVRLSKVPGIGRKTAERMVLELKGKIDPRGILSGGTSVTGGRDSELIDILMGLGYSVAEANAAVASIPAGAPDSIDDRIRLALRYFGGL
ncbi:MAG: Holliday junction branch migration protein RuvA [Roseiflexaceae bacterium]